MQRLLLAVISSLIVTACGGSAPAPSEPAYLPLEIREQREREAAQASALREALHVQSWRVTELSGQSLSDSPASLTFARDGAVSGTTGCNAINGTYTLDGVQISFGPVATTRKMCPGPIMAQERAILERLESVIMAGLSEDGTLFLSTLDGETITLAPSSE